MKGGGEGGVMSGKDDGGMQADRCLLEIVLGQIK